MTAVAVSELRDSLSTSVVPANFGTESPVCLLLCAGCGRLGQHLALQGFSVMAVDRFNITRHAEFAVQH
eukprot:5859552-Amphidinium_carterae.1